jgi:peptidoglycan hydrolase-like protein with peptidoglycan-binding domain
MSPRVLRRAVVAVTAVLVVAVVTGCGGEAEPAAGPAPEATVAAPTTTPPTTEAPTTTTPTTAPPAPTTTVAPEPSVEDIKLLQYVLGALGYFVSDEPGVNGSGTRNAVMAFQKLNGLERDGVVGPQTRAALASAAPVAPQTGTGARIEVDLDAQVAIVVAPDGAVTAINATTGAAATPTPRGRYAIFRQVDGWDPGPYGSLYRPKYFTGGIALHGGVPVLARPASHGCVRLPDPAVDWLWSSGVAATGTPVVVY